MKAPLIIIVALFIDGLQAMLSLSFAALGATLAVTTPLTGGVAGAAAGCAAGYSVASGIGAVVGCVKGAAVGLGIGATAASPLGAPIGFVFGIAINATLSLTMGAGLILLLGLNGAFSARYLWGGFGEVMPFVNILPFWTLFTVLCLMQAKRQEEGREGFFSTNSIVESLLPGGTLEERVPIQPAPERRGVFVTQRETSGETERGRSSIPLINRDIRPAPVRRDAPQPYGLAA